jgi:dTDP-4-amino-4,6-dideoxygalactose transaminase
VGRPHGDVACFSFHPRKLITTGDGGMVTTADATIDARVRAWRSHGARDGVVGFNYRLTDIQAAVGRVQLGRLPAFVESRRLLASRYSRYLNQQVECAREPSWARTNWQSYCVRLSGTRSRDAIVAALAAVGVRAGAGIANAHQLGGYHAADYHLPESERASSDCLLLPLSADMRDQELVRVVDALKLVMA